jgi:hypothetical protein
MTSGDEEELRNADAEDGRCILLLPTDDLLFATSALKKQG